MKSGSRKYYLSWAIEETSWMRSLQFGLSPNFLYADDDSRSNDVRDSSQRVNSLSQFMNKKG